MSVSLGSCAGSPAEVRSGGTCRSVSMSMAARSVSLALLGVVWGHARNRYDSSAESYNGSYKAIDAGVSYRSRRSQARPAHRSP